MNSPIDAAIYGVMNPVYNEAANNDNRRLAN